MKAHKRPMVLTAMSIVLAGIAISMPAQIMWIYGHELSEFGAIARKLTVFNWAVMLGCLVCSGLCWRGSPYLSYAIPSLVGLVAFNNLIVGYYAIDFSPLQATMATLGFAGLVMPLLHPQMRPLFSEARRLWWLRAHRRRVVLPISLRGARDVVVRAETFDISESGVFVPILPTGKQELKLEERLDICLNFGGFSQVRCEGRVVRRMSASGQYPEGIGVQFLNLDWRQKRELKRHLDRQLEV